MSNDLSIVKDVIDKQQHKVSVPNDVALNLKQKFIGIAKNQDKFLISSSKILVNFLEPTLSHKEESEEKISIRDDHDNVI